MHVFQVLILEDDAYASDIMMMLLARDYRTQVVAELATPAELRAFEAEEDLNGWKGEMRMEELEEERVPRIDVAILDTEMPWDMGLPFRIAENLSRWANPPKILCTCTYPNLWAIEKFLKYNNFAGYLVKGEALYSLASAVCLAGRGYCVITPEAASQVEKELGRESFPAKTVMLRSPGMGEIGSGLNQIGREIVRLGLLFNLPQYDIHDELAVTENWVAKTMSKGYYSLAIPDLISGEITLEELFDTPYIDNRKIVGHYREILENLPAPAENREGEVKSPKFKTMSTLAFHLLTRPEIEEWK